MSKIPMLIGVIAFVILGEDRAHLVDARRAEAYQGLTRGMAAERLADEPFEEASDVARRLPRRRTTRNPKRCRSRRYEPSWSRADRSSRLSS